MNLLDYLMEKPGHLARMLSVQQMQGSSLEQALLEDHRPAPSSIIGGRNIVAGYTRSWGLQFGDLTKAIEKDPIYQDSMEMIEGLTLLGSNLLMNLFLILKYGLRNMSGDIIEFGSYRGGSAIFLANVARRLGLKGTIYALDTFEGIPAIQHQGKGTSSLDFYLPGEFGPVSVRYLEHYANKMGLSNLVFVKGSFSETATQVLTQARPIVLAHVDCVMYDSVNSARSAVLPYMHLESGYLVVSNPTSPCCLGMLQAVEEMTEEYDLHAEQVWPHFVYRLPPLASS